MRPYKAVAVILAGGEGTRLRPLTRRRCKPAVPFGGSFRVIDFALMNCVSSELGTIYILTQYRPGSLVRHLRIRWLGLACIAPRLLATVAPRIAGPQGVFRGTSDAVYKNLEALLRHRPDVVLVLSGDHVYHADYRTLIRAHLGGNRKATVFVGSACYNRV